MGPGTRPALQGNPFRCLLTWVDVDQRDQRVIQVCYCSHFECRHEINDLEGGRNGEMGKRVDGAFAAVRPIILQDVVGLRRKSKIPPTWMNR